MELITHNFNRYCSNYLKDPNGDLFPFYYSFVSSVSFYNNVVVDNDELPL